LISAPDLKDLISTARRALSKTDTQVVSIELESPLLTVAASGAFKNIRVSRELDLETIEGDSVRNFRCGTAHEPLVKILAGVGDSAIGIEVEEPDLMISGNVKATLRTLTEDPYTHYDTPDSIWVPMELFRRFAALTPKFAASERSRYALNCGFISWDGENGELCATDGRKMVFSDFKVKLGSKSPQSGSLMIPVESMGVIGQVLPVSDGQALCEIQFSERAISVISTGIVFQSLQVEGEFPGWRAAVPEIEILGEMDSQTLKRFGDTITSVGVERARLEVRDGVLRVWGKSELVPHVETEMGLSGRESAAQINPIYLTLVNYDGERCEFGWGLAGDEITSVIVKSSQFTALLMGLDGE